MKLFLTVCCVFFLLPLCAQIIDSTVPAPPQIDTVFVSPEINIFQNLTDSNAFVNVTGTPGALPVIAKERNDNLLFFYFVAGLLLIVGLMRTFYSRYFSTLFRVFFNTSLRQNQLTDQLMQAKLPSLILNIFFVITAGLYIFLLLQYYGLRGDISDWSLISLSAGAVGVCFIIKYLSLRFTGWVTNFKNEADTYIFIVFLLNKIAGILMLPFIILLAFSTNNAASVAVTVSVILLGLILLMRFFRAYALLSSKLKISAFHFFLYVAALEILPLAVIYKGVRLFLSLNV